MALVRTELAVNRELDRLAESLPARTTRLKVAMDLQRENAQCQGVAAVALATELDTAELADELQRRLRASTERGGPPRLVRVAWAVPGGFLVEGIAPRSTAVRTVENDAELLPEVVRKLLVAWAIVPEGVRRVALYSAFAVDGRWDPRCFG